MSVLINMEMPQEKKITLTIFPDGRVYENHGERLWGYGKDCIPWKAVPVPPHGDLIGREWFIDIALHLMNTAKNDDIANGVKWLLQYIIDAPTIIPASGGKEDE